ncbi:MAG TPA: hypothetical protein VJ987_05900, partial [Anaerolineales bacterium]|nr:hypothetical protein [Anaerolineales bacterium]
QIAVPVRVRFVCAGRSCAVTPKGIEMKQQPGARFATALRISKLIPMVQPQYKREAILALCDELKKAIG